MLKVKIENDCRLPVDLCAWQRYAMRTFPTVTQPFHESECNTHISKVLHLFFLLFSFLKKRACLRKNMPSKPTSKYNE